MSIRGISPRTVTEIIVSVMQQVTEDSGEPAGLLVDESTVLFGEGGQLDSLGLVQLVLATEEAVLQETGRAVSLTDEKAMSQRNSPFRTVGTLSAFVFDLLEAEADG